MKMRRFYGLAIGCLVLSRTGARAGDIATTANPYTSIVCRNIFNLVPIPTNDPTAYVKQPDPPAKITPNGIMSLFGTPQVLFKVAVPPKQGQPPQEQSYCLSEGDREDGIEVVQIDQAARVITFNNGGIVQKIPLVPAGADGSGGSGGGAGGNSSGSGGPNHFFDSGGGGGFRTQPASSIAPGYSTSADPASDNANDGGSPNVSPTSVEGAQAKLKAIINDPNYLTPEAQVIMMEANRQQLQAAGDPTAILIPPTEITDQVEGGGDAPSDPNTATPPSP